MKLSELERDESAMLDGEEIELSNLPGVFVSIRSDQCPEYRRRLARLARTQAKKFARSGEFDPVASDHAEGMAIAETLLTGWRGIADDKDKPIPFTIEMAKRLCTEMKFRDFFDGVREAAADVGKRDAARLTDEGKN